MTGELRCPDCLAPVLHEFGDKHRCPRCGLWTNTAGAREAAKVLEDPGWDTAQGLLKLAGVE